MSGSVAIDGSIGTTTPVMEPTSDFDTNKLCLEVSKSKDVDPNARVKTYWCNGGLNQLWAVLDVKLPKLVKFSREYLDLKQSELNLVKQER